MNFTNNITSLIDPTNGLLSQFTHPDKAAGAASKTALKGAAMIPGLGMMAKTFTKSSPNTAGLRDEKTSHIQMNGSGYGGTIQAARQEQVVQHSKSGIAQAAVNNYKKASKRPLDNIANPGSCVTPHILHDMRKLCSPTALDDSLAGML